MQITNTKDTLDRKIKCKDIVKIRLVGEWLDKLFDQFIEENREIELKGKVELDSRIFVYTLSFPVESSLKLMLKLNKAEDILGYCPKVFYRVLEGSLPINNLGPFLPLQ